MGRVYNLPKYINQEELINETIEISLSPEGLFMISAIYRTISPETVLPQSIIDDTLFSTFEEAYEHIREHSFSAYFSQKVGNYVFGHPVKEEEEPDDDLSEEAWASEPLYKNNGEDFGIFQYSKKCIDEQAYQVFVSHDSAHWLKTLEDDYQEFLETVKLYDKNATDFLVAYGFIEAHPAFWLRTVYERDIKRKPSVHWASSSGISTLSIFPAGVEDSPAKYVWCVEGGEHVAYEENGIPAYSSCYHDYKLDSEGATYEEAFISFAKKVRAQLPLDGDSSK